MIQRKELIVFDQSQLETGNYSIMNLDEKIYIENLFQQLESKKERFIAESLYWKDMKEDEIAQYLKISQQAVSKWRKKILKKLKKQMRNF
ncbi:sporulation sigma factor SigF [compost metagenome]